MYKPGDLVRYDMDPMYENGIVKSKHPSRDGYYVVYNCSRRWDQYQEYTGVYTATNQLKPGWWYTPQQQHNREDYENKLT